MFVTNIILWQPTEKPVMVTEMEQFVNGHKFTIRLPISG